jgi:hypothetical protein
MTLTIEDYRRFYAEEIRFVANLNSPALVEAYARVSRENERVKILDFGLAKLSTSPTQRADRTPKTQLEILRG